jgi:predicted protein tyrosine phosphatase
MTAGAAVDDKRADERRIKELREFQRATPANKRCFDCNEMVRERIGKRVEAVRSVGRRGKAD